MLKSLNSGKIAWTWTGANFDIILWKQRQWRSTCQNLGMALFFVYIFEYTTLNTQKQHYPFLTNFNNSNTILTRILSQFWISFQYRNTAHGWSIFIRFHWFPHHFDDDFLTNLNMCFNRNPTIVARTATILKIRNKGLPEEIMAIPIISDSRESICCLQISPRIWINLKKVTAID